MNTLIGLLIIAIGSFGQSSSYVPINKVKNWSWESFWLVQGIFAWLVFPLLGALLAIPAGSSLIELWGAGGALPAMVYGVLWGVGGLTFGLSMRYLGVALGQSIALGTCAGFGTLFPALFAGKDLLHGEGLMLLIGVCITLAGIAIIGYAGSLRSKNMTEEEKRAAVKDFALTKGLLVALLAGVMSACFALGLDAGTPIKEAALAGGVEALYAGLPVIFLVTLGGFCTNAAYCIWQNIKNKTGKEYLSVKGSVLTNNLLFCALAGVLWYSQFFGIIIWYLFLQSGIHSTISGVILAFVIPARPRLDAGKYIKRIRDIIGEFPASKSDNIVLTNAQIATLKQVERASDHVISPLQSLEDNLHGAVNFVILPLFAFANAGVVFSGSGNIVGDVSMAVAAGLLLGKFLGIYLFTWLSIKSGLALMPAGMNWKNIAGVSLLGGIGFTVSLFIANLSFADAYPELLNQAKFGVLLGTLLAGVLGYVVLNIVLPKAE